MFDSVEEAPWLSEMGLENPMLGDPFDLAEEMDDELAAFLGPNFEIPCLSPMNECTPMVDPPAKLQKRNSHSAAAAVPARTVSTPIIINFGNEKPPPVNSTTKSPTGSDSHTEEPKPPPQPVRKSSRIRPQSQTYDHIIAERKRREQLSQRFLALSSIVPGPKTDKISVLEDAIKYLKFLQEKVHLLEEQTTKKSIESVVVTRKSMAGNMEDPLSEIEVRLCNSQIMISVECEYKKGILANILYNVEKLNLTVVNTYVASVGRLLHHITIVTEMEKGFSLTVKQVANKIEEGIVQS